MINIIFSLILFYFLALVQTSFLVHYEIRGSLLNIVFLLIILFNFFDENENKLGLVVGITGGFYLDVFCSSYPGLFTLLGIAIALLVRMLKPFFEIKKSISFIIILFVALLFYEIIFSLLTLGNNFYFNIFSLIYNLLIGIILYLLIKMFYALVQKGTKK
ncbi:MAG: hypothetical protein U9Q96_02045 [Patescibacteria group bacterium]|nr:hypothetical protein [Patescibacteria group bacterium]